MKIEITSAEPIERFTYKVVAQGGKDHFGNVRLKDTYLPIYTGILKGCKSDEFDGLILTSDLQGNVIEKEEIKLLGEVLPDFLQLLLKIEFPEIKTEKVGVLLCGDLFARIDKRGGEGDVKAVWKTFKNCFGFVAGVAGNHDYFGSKSEFEEFQREKDIYYLDRQIRKIRGIKVGGIGGVIGRPDKLFRTEESEYLSELRKLLKKAPDLILLHEGPDSESPSRHGNEKIRKLIELSNNQIICFGHNHWDELLINKRNGNQYVNLDGKCLILINEK